MASHLQNARSVQTTMKSMTGFGAAEVSTHGGKIIVEVRSVNQRFLDLRVRLPQKLSDLQLWAEQVARKQLRRGRVDIAIRTEGLVELPLSLDLGRARAAWNALTILRDEVAPKSEIPLSMLAAVPDLFSGATGADSIELKNALQSAIEISIENMNTMCSHEGHAIAEELLTRTDVFMRYIESVDELIPQVKKALRERVSERLHQVLQDRHPTFETERLETELVLWVERNDFSEEVSRLRCHLNQFCTFIRGTCCDPIGKKLDFLLQEMIREANTLGSKAQDASISHLVVSMKVELERMREQVQNVA